MRVEFIGLPGAGKSTLRRNLLYHLQREDKKQYLSTEEAFLQVSRSHIDNIYRRALNILPHRLALRASNRLMNRSLMQFEAQNRFLAEYGKALEAFFTSNVYLNMSPKDRKLVIGSFLEMGSLWQCIKESLNNEAIVFFEEGFVQKSFLFVDQSTGSMIENEKLCSYLENIPIPDVVIYITANIETCHRRMIGRPEGLTERLKEADKNKITSFLTNAQNHLEFVAEWLSDNYGEIIIEVNGEKGLEEISPIILKKIQQLF